jgi:DNA-binding transcriptional ArsR family regulator
MPPPSPSTWAALADPHRRTMLAHMLERPRAVNELVQHTGLSQPGTSKHLRVLREAGLVEAARRGTWAYYRLVPEAVESLRAALGG